MARLNLTDVEWAAIERLLPADMHGKERVDDRRVLNGLVWRLRTGAPWADIPARYGSHTTCGNRFRRWRKRGSCDRPVDAVSKACDGGLQMIDVTSVRVHQHAACARKRSPMRWHGLLARQPDKQDPRAGKCGIAERTVSRALTTPPFG